ncbi:23S rRNA (guanosine(2251)-2'-O)-methyltransferase RlmB [Labrys okinawensis]|uniref:23S rRNA (Guanosine(2251)-2'-O)-methyltransferase RlmB n=1 Tax=Labrys okinawensis TaxID=346911 RepID=A0A2S9Q4U3_9HYPH|nr:RNA methyltransferase [Labrys okinawensis]PRH84379.1 23S rRNA (guanosine(2251)-2'-O)-methyltransferase RlmB [Labrys okinawensis]
MKDRDRRGHRGHHRGYAGEATPDTVVIYGWHPVREALQNPKRKLKRLLATENALKRLADEKVETRIKAETVRPGDIDRLLTPDSIHQGLYLEAAPLPAPAFGELGAQDIVLVLDQITDPHNVGAIIRSAAAFKVAAIITTERHSPAATGVLAKSASGGLEHVPVISVRNLGDTLDEMGESGVTRIGLDSEGPATLEGTAFGGPLALVLGAEGKGLRQRTRSLCDALARLDMPGAIKSLNVSNAAALALYVARAKIPA